MNEMTKSQRKIYDYIAKQREDNLPSPTLAEIAKHMGFTSSGASQFVVNSMIEKGYLLHEKGKMRALVCVPMETNEKENV